MPREVISDTSPKHLRVRESIDVLLLEGLRSGAPVPLSDDDWQLLRDKVDDRLTKRSTAQE